MHENDLSDGAIKRAAIERTPSDTDWAATARAHFIGGMEEAVRRAKANPWQLFDAALGIPRELHPETQRLVIEFASALANKLRKSEVKYGWTIEWKNASFDDLSDGLKEHINKGDPVDVAAFCAFIWAKSQAELERRKA